jgi:2,4'-dihydroxyacetophenone dioxygenase
MPVISTKQSGPEFWRGTPAIPDFLKPDALPEVHIGDAATEDMRYYAPLSETVFTRPLWISPSKNMWCDIVRSTAAGFVNRHYHPREIFAYTISGRWGYLEHEWIAEAGDFVYEAPGEGHTLVMYESPEPTRVFFVVNGPLIWLDEKGNGCGHFDVHDYIKLCRDHYEKVGLGADAVTQLFR